MAYTPIVVIVAYLTIVTAIGMILKNRTRSASDWSVAGGGMGILMIAAGVAGTRIGGGGTYGVAGNVMSGGVWNLWWYSISTFVAMALVGAFFAIPYRRLHLHTVGEIFQVRFKSNRNQALTSFCVQTEYLIVNVIEAYVIAIILTGVTGLPREVTVAIAATVLISYVAMSGLWGTAVTNLIHCTVIIVGLLVVGLMGIHQLGGWQALTSIVNEHLQAGEKSDLQWWSFLGGGIGAALGMVFSAAVHTPAASVYTNYATSAKSEKIILPAFLLAGVIGGIMPLLAGLIGIETLAQYGLQRGFDSYENITALAAGINPVIGGLALAAILAAVISSGGPILLSSATMFVRDWLWFTRDFSEAKKLKAYRWTTVIYGITAALLAWGWMVSDSPISILDILLFGFAMVVPPAITVGYLIYWKRTTEAGAFWGMVAGYAGGLIWYVIIRWALWVEYTAASTDPVWRRIFYYCFVHDGKGIDPSYLTTLLPLIIVPIVSLMTTEDKEGAEEFYATVSGISSCRADS